MMDILWQYIHETLLFVQGLVRVLLSPLDLISPTLTITLLALLALVLTTFLTKRFKTNRYKELKQEFEYWFAIKQEALALQDQEPEKAKFVARSIDQAKLNQVYYDFFFEGLLNNLLTVYIPVLSILLYVNATYTPEFLQNHLGASSLFRFSLFNSPAIDIGAGAWFVVVLLGLYCGWQCAQLLLRKWHPSRNRLFWPGHVKRSTIYE
jgi:hypothetical protein